MCCLTLSYYHITFISSAELIVLVPKDHLVAGVSAVDRTCSLSAEGFGSCSAVQTDTQWGRNDCDCAWGVSEYSGGPSSQKGRSNYQGITLLWVSEKVYSGVLERKFWPIAESGEQCTFGGGRGTVDQIFRDLLKGSWEFDCSVCICFVDQVSHFPQNEFEEVAMEVQGTRVNFV